MQQRSLTLLFQIMNFHHVCRAALFVGSFLAMKQDASAEPLNAFRWKSRLIIAFVPSGESRDPFAASLAANRAEMDERDLKVIDFSAAGTGIPGTIRLDPKQTTVLREKLKLDAGETAAVFVLIGKDGTEKARQRGTLKLADWFALIDAMPMRRDEIRLRGKSRQ